VNSSRNLSSASIGFCLLRKQGDFQALEQTFRKQPFTLEMGTHPVKPRERFLTFVIRECETRDIDL